MQLGDSSFRLLTNSVRLPLVVLLTLAALTTACDPSEYATIESPKNYSTYAVGDSILFHGNVKSLGEMNSLGPPGISLVGRWHWTSNLDGELGDTPVFVRTDLSAGEHLISFSVANANGTVRYDRARIFVK